MNIVVALMIVQIVVAIIAIVVDIILGHMHKPKNTEEGDD